ncbi:MAG: hypothetical protein V1659_00190 [Candidatus Woesearchaeota archaeon]
MKFYAGKWILGGIVFGIIAWIINGILGMLTGRFYTGDIWRPMIGGSFIVTTLAFNILGGLLFALMYAFLYRGVPCKTGAGKGALFGFFILIGTTLYGMCMSYLFVKISLVVILFWILGALLSNVIGGAALGAIYNPKKEKE